MTMWVGDLALADGELYRACSFSSIRSYNEVCLDFLLVSSSSHVSSRRWIFYYFVSVNTCPS